MRENPPTMVQSGAPPIKRTPAAATGATMTTPTLATAHQSHGGTLYYVVEVPRAEYESGAKHANGYTADGPQRSIRSSYRAPTVANHVRFFSLFRTRSTESGWDNPFRPGGDLSREADEIVNMIKGKWCGSSGHNHQIAYRYRFSFQAANRSHRPVRMAAPAARRSPTATAPRTPAKTDTQMAVAAQRWWTAWWRPKRTYANGAVQCTANGG